MDPLPVELLAEAALVALNVDRPEGTIQELLGQSYVTSYATGLKRGGHPEWDKWIAFILLLGRVAGAGLFLHEIYHAYITGGVMPMGMEWISALINLCSMPNLINQLRGRTANTDKTEGNPGSA